MRDQAVPKVTFRVQSGRTTMVDVSTYASVDRFAFANEVGQLGAQTFVAVRDRGDLVLIYADGTLDVSGSGELRHQGMRQ